MSFQSAACRLLLKDALNSPIVGHGLGSSQNFITDITYHVHLPHNEFLRLFHDLGIVGMFLFIMILFTFYKMTEPNSFYQLIAIIGILSTLLSMAFDNTFWYYLEFGQMIYLWIGFGIKLSTHNESFFIYKSLLPRRRRNIRIPIAQL